jgi:hypothetical protein
MLGSLSAVFHSTAFTVARDLALFCVVLLWLGCAFWTHRDAKRRIDDLVLVWTATLLGLFPVVGPLAYLLFRPPETLEEARARGIELRALETRLEPREPQCPLCRTAVDAAFLICPVCTTRLKKPCRACKAPLEPLWQACPYCAVPVKATGLQPPATLELDTALTAEIASNGNGKARAGRPRRAAAS